MKFSIKDFFSKCDQRNEEILNGKLQFLCSVSLGNAYWLDFYVKQVNSVGTARPTSHFSLPVTTAFNLFASPALKIIIHSSQPLYMFYVKFVILVIFRNRKKDSHVKNTAF